MEARTQRQPQGHRQHRPQEATLAEKLWGSKQDLIKTFLSFGA